MKVISVFFTLLFISLSSINCNENGKELIKIGVVLPLTGESSQWGIPPRNGAVLAVENINNKGGIHGKKIKLQIEDGKCNAQYGVDALNKLINTDKPIAIIGEVCSSSTLAMAPIAEKNKIVLISPASTNPKISNAGDYIFRVIPSDELRGKVFAEYITSLGYKNASILYINNDGGKGNAESFSKYFQYFGGKISSEDTYEAGSTEIRTQLSNIKSVNASCLLVVSYLEDAIVVINKIKELGINIPLFFQTEALDDPNVIKNVGSAANGITFISYAKTESEISSVFIREYKQKYNEEPGLYASEGFDAVMIIASILEERNDFSSESIKSGLYSIKNYSGASGKLSFDQNGDVVKPFAIKKIENNSPKILIIK